MKSILSASRRTDIPAFYLTWFMDAIKTGSIEITNPLYPAQKRTVQLTPDKVAWIVFWSRNYAHFIKRQTFFSAYNLFFHFTILPQSKSEPYALPLKVILRQMATLAESFGPDRIIWRYDPIVFWQEKQSLKSNHDIGSFQKLCTEMGAMDVQRCYTSFVFPYKKFIDRLKRYFPGELLIQPETGLQLRIIRQMVDTAAKYGITLFSCCNDSLLQIEGIKKGRCIDGNLLNQLSSANKVSVAKNATRKDCGCTRSIDIGNYVTQPCPFGCIYCYANPVKYDSYPKNNHAHKAFQS